MSTPSDVERVLRVAVPAASDIAGSEMDEAEISCWGGASRPTRGLAGGRRLSRRRHDHHREFRDEQED